MTWWLSDKADVHGQSLSLAAQTPVFFFFSWVHGIEDITMGQHFLVWGRVFFIFEFIALKIWTILI
jgi:hypothetical protein